MAPEPVAFLVIIISMMPVVELRAGIPYGIIASGLPFPLIYLIAVTANIIVAPAAFFFLDFVHGRLMQIRVYRRIFGTFAERTKKKAESRISRFGYPGLFLLVAIPLPGTGAYTATLAAWLFGMERKKAIISISAGVAAAGVIVTAATLTGVGVTILISESAGEKIASAFSSLLG